MKKLALAASLVSAFALSACDKGGGGFNIPKNRDLKAGGVYVAYNLGCEAGCDQIKKGDLIQKVDGKDVKTADDVGNLADNAPHKLELLSAGTMEPKSVEITASPKKNLEPIKDAPPLWLVSAEALNKAPDWARRRMFGHASPSVMLVSSDGGILDGRQLYGKKRVMVYWDWGDREEEASAIDFMQVLQKAQADLNAANVEIMFVHVRFPTGRKAAMNDSDLRAWQKKWTVKEGGTKLAEVPMYRFPNETEFNAARELGMEGSFTVFENLGQSPAIVVLNEDGIVMWHSEGINDNPNSEIKDPEQATIIPAVEFAKGL
ncbi:MAG: PDZ domain-containing protein [Myxococcota bacterium]